MNRPSLVVIPLTVSQRLAGRLVRESRTSRGLVWPGNARILAVLNDALEEAAGVCNVLADEYEQREKLCAAEGLAQTVELYRNQRAAAMECAKRIRAMKG